MPYITTEDVKARRKAIKAALPEYKLSVTKDGHSGILVAFMAGPLTMTDNDDGYCQVNHYYIGEHYADRPEVAEVLQKAYEIAKAGQRITQNDADYGAIPNFYVNIHIGKWDRPYQVTQKKAA